MNPMLHVALQAARRASDMLYQASDRLDRLEIQQKGHNDFVTQLDRAAEEIVFQSLQKLYPYHGYLGEESGFTPGQGEGAEVLWILDPLDGTTNYLHGLPHYAVSLACVIRGKIEHAVVIDPSRQEEFTASRGQGATMNAKRLRVSICKDLTQALIATGVPSRGPQKFAMTDFTTLLQDMASKCSGIRHSGSASLDLAYVAAGRLDGYWEFGLSPWDMAAGILLIQESGGLVCDFDGGHHFLERGQIAASNPKCLRAMMSVINPLKSEGMVQTQPQPFHEKL